MNDKLVEKLATSEYFEKFINQTIETLSNERIYFDNWKSIVILYAKLNKISKNKKLLKELETHLYLANVIVTDEQKELYTKILSKLPTPRLNYVNNPNILKTKLIESRIKRLKDYLDSKTITYYEWLKLYRDLMTTCSQLDRITEFLKELIIEYSNLLGNAKIMSLTEINKQDYETKIKQLESLQK